MKSMGRAIQLTRPVSFALILFAYAPFVAAATYPSCPTGKTCLKVTSASATGSGCTLINAVTAVNTQKTFNGCTFPSGATVVLLPVLSGTTTTYSPNTTLTLTGTTIKGVGVTQTIINFKNAIATSNHVAIDFPFSNQQNVGLQFLAVVDGGSTQGGFTGVQTESDAPLVTLDHVQVSGFVLTGVVNNSLSGLVITNSTIENNSGDQGGGIHDMQGATMSIDTSTIAHNSALGGAGIFEEGDSWLAYDTVAFNGAEVGGGIYISDPASLDAFHVTVAMNSASLPFTALGPCGVGGGVYAPDPDSGVDANWNASIITGNTDGTSGKADDLVGDLHFPAGGSEIQDGANNSIVGNPQVGTSCQVGGWRSNTPSGPLGSILLNDKQASPAQLFGTSSPTLASHPSTAPTQDFALVKPKSGTNPAINAVQNSTYNLGTYETAGATFPGGKYTSGRLSNPGQNKIDQGGQPAPSDGNQNLNYSIGSFEIQ
jgi:hypothetical protein